MHWLLWISGAGLAALAILAYQLGIDHTPDWGSSRWIMLSIGVFLILTGVIIRWKQAIGHQLDTLPFVKQSRQTIGRISQSSFVRKLGKSALVRWFTQLGSTSVGSMAAIIVATGCLTAWWLVSAGYMTQFPGTTTYYDRLAEGFLHGQLSLLEIPDARLAELSNPYDYQARADIPALWDASYFQGKYYLYWGPVPAILICAVKWLHPLPVGDLSLTLAFVIGMMIVQVWLITAAYRQWFAHLPAGLAIPPLLAATFSAPLLWLLARPSIYEAAIAGGQFFWLAGLAFALKGFTAKPQSLIWFLVTGLSWAASIGCRANMAIPIGITCMGLAVIFFMQPTTRRAILAVAMAISLGMGGLAWYNLARFGSVLETGYSYQLTGPAAVSVVDGQLFSSPYILPNLYNYFLRPPLVDNEFPFIHSPWITESMWPFFIRIPQYYYYSEPISGLLLICPFILFLPAIFRVKKLQPYVLILLAATAGSILASLVFITSFMRYLLDFSPGVMLLATIGFWQANEKPSAGWIGIGFILSIISTGSGILLGVAGPTNNFLNNNPALYQWLSQIFGH